MSELIDECMTGVTYIEQPTLEDYILTDIETRVRAIRWMGKKISVIR